MVSPWGSEEREPVQLEEPARREDGRDDRSRQREPRRAQHQQGAGEVDGEAVARLRGQLVATGEEAADCGELVRRHTRHVPGVRRRHRLRRAQLSERRLLGALAYDERARRYVAETLVLSCDENGDDADEVHPGQDVDEAEHVADRAREEVDWAAVDPHHPQAVHALAGRAAGGEDLEEDVVRREDEEARDEDERVPEAAAEGLHRRPEPGDADEEHDLEQEVEERRDEPRAHPRERQLEVDSLRRRDGDAIVELHAMNVEGFVRDREASWRELDELVARSRRRFHRLGPDEVRRLGALYRSAAADLSLARRRFPRDPVVGGLAELVGRARHAVYASGSRRGSIVRFFARDYWRFVAERPLPLVLSAVLLFAPASLAGAWALHDRPAATGLGPSQFRPVP